MSKRSNSRRRRGISISYSTANHRLPFSTPSVRVSPLSLFEDRRTFHPAGIFRPLRSTVNRVTVTSRDRTYSNKSLAFNRLPFRSQTKAAMAFANPGRVLVCVRRNIRKEVLHAFRKTGKVGQRRPRRNIHSSISC